MGGRAFPAVSSICRLVESMYRVYTCTARGTECLHSILSLGHPYHYNAEGFSTMLGLRPTGGGSFYQTVIVSRPPQENFGPSLTEGPGRLVVLCTATKLCGGRCGHR